MTINIKLAQLVLEDKEGKLIVGDALKLLLDTEMPSSLRFKLYEIAEEAQANIQNYHQQKLTLIKPNSTEQTNEKGEVTGYQTNPDKLDFVREELMKLLDIDVTLPWHKFDLDHFKVIPMLGAIKWLFNPPAE